MTTYREMIEEIRTIAELDPTATTDIGATRGSPSSMPSWVLRPGLVASAMTGYPLLDTTAADPERVEQLRWLDIAYQWADVMGRPWGEAVAVADAAITQPTQAETHPSTAIPVVDQAIDALTDVGIALDGLWNRAHQVIGEPCHTLPWALEPDWPDPNDPPIAHAIYLLHRAVRSIGDGLDRLSAARARLSTATNPNHH